MKRTFCRLICLILTLLWIMGCDTALTVGSKTMGFRSGEFIYTDGYLRTTYAVPFDPMWTVCERTLTEMNAVDVEPVRKIATGSLTAMIQDEKVRIEIEYVERGITAVSIRVGLSGNNLASQLLHDRIAGNLKTR